MSIVKVVCTLVATASLHVIFTPPTPTPAKREQGTPTMGERYLQAAFTLLFPVKFTFWTVALAEIATLVAHDLPLSPMTHVHSTLDRFIGLDASILRLTPKTLLGMILIFFGALIRYICYRTLSNFFTFEMSIRDHHKLLTTGPYGVVRHPSYTGMVAAQLGMVLWYGSRGSWLRESGIMRTTTGQVGICLFAAMLLGVLWGLLSRMTTEDHALKKEFGNDWDEWAQRVPYALIPGIY